jgi:hypothetical protein
MWVLRKYLYNGIPPTDPRILAMTDELIDLEYAHMELDKQLKGGKEEYEDPDYEDYDKETDETDAQLSYEYDMPASEDVKPTAIEPDEEDDGDWEDVETDDLDN